MATVKSLEERIDDMADDMSAVKIQLGSLVSSQATIQAQLASLVNSLNATQTQLSVAIVRLDMVISELNKTNGRIDTVTVRLDGLVTDFAAFRAKTDNSFGVARWAVVFAASVLITVIGSGFWIAREAGRLENRVEHQQKTLDDIRRDVAEIRTKLNK